MKMYWKTCSIFTTKFNRSFVKYFGTDAAPLTNRIKEKVGFIGDGNMAKAISHGIEQKGLVTSAQIYVSSPFPQTLKNWSDWGAHTFTDNNDLVESADIVFLAVKPHIVLPALENLKPASARNTLFVSTIAGLTIHELEKRISQFPGSRVVRTMPNTPLMVGAGCTAYCPGACVTTADLRLVETIFTGAGGICEKVPEHDINAVGAVSASGPAFVYMFIEALSDGAVKMGLHRSVATRIAAQTVMGAAKMVLDTGRHPGPLKDDVCSAGGTTIAGLHALERHGVRGAVMSAIEASAKRANEIGREKHD